MFIGEFSHSIDQKGRLAIPYRFRKYLKGGAVVARGIIDKCLCLYPKEEWEKLAKKLTALPISDAKVRALTRLTFSQAVEVGFDRQGRILLPNYLREYAGLKTQAVISGAYTFLEIWNAKSWQEYKAKSERAGKEISEHLRDLGI